MKPNTKVDLAQWPTRTKPPITKEAGVKLRRQLLRRLAALQELMYAESKHSVLAVFQAMDAGGKDSTTQAVFGPINPQGVRVSSFKAPTTLEQSHDFLWRVHAQCPPKGYIKVFNRSHYEDVLIVKVKQLATNKIIEKRYDHINAFERLLADSNTHVVKFFLHISNDYQKARLQRRLDRPDKHWKFDPGDLEERKLWPQYQAAYGEAISRCSTSQAPWYIVPAERRWYRNLVVLNVMVNVMESLDMSYPEPTFDFSGIHIE